MRLFIFSLLFSFFTYLNVQSQKNENWNMLSVGKIHFSLDMGHRIEAGTYGISFHYFLMDYFSIFISGGTGASSFNGALFSVGGKYFQPIKDKHGLVFSCYYTLSGGFSDVLGDDDSPHRVWIHTSPASYFRTHLGYALMKSGFYLLFNLGYSLPIESGTYHFSGPGTASNRQIRMVKNGLGKGINFGVNMVLDLSSLKRPITKKNNHSN